MVKQIVLVKPRGFCAGVARAVKILDLAVAKNQRKVYTRHQIVHNRKVVADFVKRGVKFVEDLKEIPDGSVVVFSAHGSPPSLYEEAEKKQLTVIDATCPLVAKVHQEAKRFYQQGYFIIYLGHRGHPEPAGVLAEIPKDSYVLIETLKQAQALKLANKKLVLLTQTTLSFDDTQSITEYLKKRFPNLKLPPAYDVCYATQNRQNAVKALAKEVDAVLVIGSKTSSNSNRLVATAKILGRPAYLVDHVSQLQNQWFKNCTNLGITAGASAPESLIKEIVSAIQNQYGGQVKELEVLKEQVEFPI